MVTQKKFSGILEVSRFRKLRAYKHKYSCLMKKKSIKIKSILDFTVTQTFSQAFLKFKNKSSCLVKLHQFKQYMLPAVSVDN